jgi:hypothetical protein
LLPGFASHDGSKAADRAAVRASFALWS